MKELVLIIRGMKKIPDQMVTYGEFGNIMTLLLSSLAEKEYTDAQEKMRDK
jgi:hypothetical protein